jgi:methionyl aminopeptidase
MIETLNAVEIETMREAGRSAAIILKKLAKFVKPGNTTKDIETAFDTFLGQYPGRETAFKGFMGYPASLCVSVNDEIIHGIPSSRLINPGDCISIDLGIKYNGLFVDTACTYAAARVPAPVKKLIQVCRRALYEGIKKARIGARIGDIGFAIQSFVEKKGFSVIRKFVGHGIGRSLHLYPEVPNFGIPGEGPQLIEGMGLAIEPMICMGDCDVNIANDGWTAKTKDGSLSAHFEHTIAITKRGPVILTAR